MPSRMETFQSKLAALIKARFPLIYIPTWEEERAVATVASVLENKAFLNKPRSLFVWTSTIGFTDATGAPQFTPDTREPFKALWAIEKYPHPGVFVMKDFHVYLGEAYPTRDMEVIRKIRDLSPLLKQAGKHLVFLSPSLTLPHELQKDVYILDFELPTDGDIQRLLHGMIEANRASGRIVVDLTADESERLAKAALGLTYQEAENAFALSMAHDGRLSIEDLDVITREKQQIVKKTGFLEFIDNDLNLDDVGGLENLKAWLAKRNKSWLDAARRYGLPAPKGILMLGVPGCGKSLVAKAMSSMWHLPLLRFDIGKIFSPYVGTSEDNMRKALMTAEAIAPSVLWVDEIEKGLSGMSSSSDNGVASRVFGSFLTWMQEKTKPVFVVATANNIEALPSELLRKGRFDELFFVDLPTASERMAIFRIHLQKRLKDPHVVGTFRLTDTLLQELAAMTQGFVGSEIEQVVIAALFDAFSEDRSLLPTDLTRAIQATVSLSVTQAENIQKLRHWAQGRAVPATLSDKPPRIQV